MKKAFTLAEALLIMVLLGIIATITMTVFKPGQFKTRAYITLAESAQAEIEEGLMKVALFNSSHSLAGLTGKQVGDELKNYVATSRNDVATSLSETCKNASYSCMVLKNGVSFAILNQANTERNDICVPGDSEASSQSGTYGIIEMDINGNEGPNQLCSDIFRIPINVNILA